MTEEDKDEPAFIHKERDEEFLDSTKDETHSQKEDDEREDEFENEEKDDEGDSDEDYVQKRRKRKKDSAQKKRVTIMERIRRFCTRADVFASAHILPVHVLCIIVATIIIPISLVSIVWDLMAGIVFEKPDLSTIELPAFVLFINFIAMPLAMYGYMMEFLMHERSKLAQVGLVCVVVHPILFLIRGLIEVFFDGFRSEEKLYFEGFNKIGAEAKYPIGIVRYRGGFPFSDSKLGNEHIELFFRDRDNRYG